MPAAADAAAPSGAAPKLVERFRKDYLPLPFSVTRVELDFALGDETSRVTSRLLVTPNALAGDRAKSYDLVLDGGEGLRADWVEVDGRRLDEAKGEFSHLPAGGLVVPAAQLPLGAESYAFAAQTTVRPQDNTEFEGLYRSNGTFCTQCEAEGFRNITFYPDRPDAMATFRVRVEADRAAAPVLLSNGNLVEEGEVAGASPARHYAIWEDPFRKPCYLFALVAGDLVAARREFATASGKPVALALWTRARDADRTAFALDSLEEAMRWDERRFGLEYDLGVFNVVAVDDFNMGAMENKGLNVFNSLLVLSSPASATDADHARIEGVVGHEYFHNWTGNRVTCRDWFQLTLKEGLTVYRDQEFSSDMGSRPVKRIQDVQRLRAAQFPEDAGPTAHPIRPESYVKMDNFYTATVYEKGAEVIRMYEELLGRDGFRKGIDLYFARHDGSAVTCDDFRAAMADANGVDLSGLDRWYRQAGTPLLRLKTEFDAAADGGTLRVTASQTVPPTPGQPTKVPVPIPIRFGLVDRQTGEAVPIKVRGPGALVQPAGAPDADLAAPPAASDAVADLGDEGTLLLDRDEQTFTLVGVGAAEPLLSPLRGLSAPVRLEVEGRTQEDLALLLAKDKDEFVRWDAAQSLARDVIKQAYAELGELDARADGAAAAPDAVAALAARLASASGLSAALRSVLADDRADDEWKALALSFPPASEVRAVIPKVDPLRLHRAAAALERRVAEEAADELRAAVARADAALEGKAYRYAPEDVGHRALRSRALSLLASLETREVAEDLVRRAAAATNMTDEMGALFALDHAGHADLRKQGLDAFFERWKDEPLVLLKWISVQASSNAPDNVRAVEELMAHPSVKLTNPNTCYQLFLGFARSAVNFHAEDGSGYAFIADAVLRLDAANRQVAARVVGTLRSWRDYDDKRAGLIKDQLRRIANTKGISDNVLEIAARSLGDE